MPEVIVCSMFLNVVMVMGFIPEVSTGKMQTLLPLMIG